MISTNAFALLATLPQTAALLMETKSEDTAQQIVQESPSVKSQLRSKGLLKDASKSLQDHMDRHKKGFLINLEKGTTVKYNFGKKSCLHVFSRDQKPCNMSYINSPWLVVEVASRMGRYPLHPELTVSHVSTGFQEVAQELKPKVKWLQPRVLASNGFVRVTHNLECMDHKLDDEEVSFWQQHRWTYVRLLTSMIEQNVVADQTMMCHSKEDGVKLLPSSTFATFEATSSNKDKIVAMLNKISEVFAELAPTKEATDVETLVTEAVKEIWSTNAMNIAHVLLLQLDELHTELQEEQK